MHNNFYLGNCLCIIYRPSDKEILSDFLSSKYILILLKSQKDLSNISTVKKFISNNIFQEKDKILLRISSECLLGSFGDSHCDCESQKISVLKEINNCKQGIYIHIPQEAQGNGLFYKAKELELQVNGINPSGKYVKEQSIKEASEYLLKPGDKLDKRNYASLISIVKQLKLNRYKYDLICDNPYKIQYFKKKAKIRINPKCYFKQNITIDNVGEFLSKIYMKDFVLTDEELHQIYLTLLSTKKLPQRVISILHYLQEDFNNKKEFNINIDYLKKILSILKIKHIPDQIQSLTILKDSESYSEYQIELKIKSNDIKILFQEKILQNDEELFYEVNNFYDLMYFKNIPSRSLKIRKSYRLRDINRPISQKLIYKVHISGNKYAIKSIPILHEDVISLIELALSNYEIHFLPVFTHNIFSNLTPITILIKRYSHDLRTLSLMGDENEVNKFIKILSKLISIKKIDDPTNHRFLIKDLAKNFEWNKLSRQELNIYKKYHNG